MGIFNKNKKQDKKQDEEIVNWVDQFKPQRDNSGLLSPELVEKKYLLEERMISSERLIIENNVRLERMRGGNYQEDPSYVALNKDVIKSGEFLETCRKEYLETFGEEACEKAKKECFEKAIKLAGFQLRVRPRRELVEYSYDRQLLEPVQENHIDMFYGEKQRQYNARMAQHYEKNIIGLLQEQNKLLKQQISLLEQLKPANKRQPKQQQEKGME